MPEESTNPQLSAWCKLWHPRGPQVTLPLPPDPAAALAAVSAALDAGWLVTAPGLEEGEEKEQVGWALRSIHINEDRETPFVLLYSANEALTWSILKVYLNTDQDREAFEHASHMKLAEMPEYVGQDKPQRGANRRTDTYIVPAPRPFGVVCKKNPKHDPNTEAGKMKPARLFVRWADTAPAPTPADDTTPATNAERDALDAKMIERQKATGKKVNLLLFLRFLGAESIEGLTRGQIKKGMDALQGHIDAAEKGGAA